MSDAESILRKVLNKITDQLQYNHAKISLKELTSGGANYTSALYSVTVTAPDQDVLKLFAKVANVNQVLRKVMNIDFMFKTEQFVYSDLVKVYEKIQDKNQLSPEHRFEFPRFFGGQSVEGEETVVLEDLTAKGFDSFSRFKSIDWEHAACAVEYLARFHALSFAYQKEDPDNFARDAEQVKTRRRDEAVSSSFTETWKRMVSSAINVAKEEHKERLAKLLEADNGRDEFHKFKTPLSTTVLCHGDFRISNMLFRGLVCCIFVIT